MTVETTLALTEQDVRSYSAKVEEAAWMADFRSNALAKAEVLEMPTPDKTKITKWNFTEFPSHTVESSIFAGLEEMPTEAKALIDDEQQQNIYVQHNNTPAYLSLSEDLKSQGVILTDIFTASREHSELLQKYLMTDGVKVDEHKLTALHAALINGGVFVYVPKNVVIEDPLQVLFIHDNEEASLFNHVVIVAEENSQVTYVESYLSTMEHAETQANIVSEVFAMANAKIVYGSVDVLAEGMTTYVNRRGVTGPHARIEWALGLMNDGNTISENITHLVGDGSSSDMKSVVVGRGSQKQNFTSEIVHWGLDTDGFILKHGVMKENSSAIFNGIGRIAKGATRSNAVQESRILMLGERGRGDANPILLIDENDVTAGHAASVGRVDPLQMFYLMSRGISQEEAERLIIHGFLAPVVSKLPIAGVRKQLTEVIERKVR
ncbi:MULTISPECIES: Fe-S cluster assembly protein SufD [unclassified Sporosarcina]|uniref:Fe-S cluster assembly protein SufD n=1 Tax=unclassified Sporosarcina TaxID=2647733 RepID=UPI000C167600|nr:MULTISPECIES: Fe-S cluster assembly protein SufD [unclassified Sporosarcina]PIC99255.1 Fe-S cluster assembly protein SufD [Sporosarcina sp. P29]PID05386.1 Fe-S cluster assembly protein SufD [Sporosarcina sp. P30]PID08581.1 Fe-S cluster assembly protein SufD [Sporosarcina sp. P31]PID11583.1 Fe-S cluster assembly protein SufD [Sporosarcina sp. P32b]